MTLLDNLKTTVEGAAVPGKNDYLATSAEKTQIKYKLRGVVSHKPTMAFAESLVDFGIAMQRVYTVPMLRAYLANIGGAGTEIKPVKDEDPIVTAIRAELIIKGKKEIALAAKPSAWDIESLRSEVGGNLYQAGIFFMIAGLLTNGPSLAAFLKDKQIYTGTLSLTAQNYIRMLTAGESAATAAAAQLLEVAGKKYYTLVQFHKEHNAWAGMFGAYDKEDVAAELQDFLDHGVKKKDLKIITSDSSQRAIDDAILKLNQTLEVAASEEISLEPLAALLDTYAKKPLNGINAQEVKRIGHSLAITMSPKVMKIVIATRPVYGSTNETALTGITDPVAKEVVKEINSKVPRILKDSAAALRKIGSYTVSKQIGDIGRDLCDAVTLIRCALFLTKKNLRVFSDENFQTAITNASSKLSPATMTKLNALMQVGLASETAGVEGSLKRLLETAAPKRNSMDFNALAKSVVLKAIISKLGIKVATVLMNGGMAISLLVESIKPLTSATIVKKATRLQKMLRDQIDPSIWVSEGAITVKGKHHDMFAISYDLDTSRQALLKAVTGKLETLKPSQTSTKVKVAANTSGVSFTDDQKAKAVALLKRFKTTIPSRKFGMFLRDAAKKIKTDRKNSGANIMRRLEEITFGGKSPMTTLNRGERLTGFRRYQEVVMSAAHGNFTMAQRSIEKMDGTNNQSQIQALADYLQRAGELVEVVNTMNLAPGDKERLATAIKTYHSIDDLSFATQAYLKTLAGL